MKKLRNLLCAVLMTLLAFGSVQVMAADTVTVDVTGTYGQTEARSMLAMVNEFRTGSDAWVWNSDNTTKTTYTDLQEYTYDYGLEQVAMQRALEIAIVNAHTRPIGTAWSILNTNGARSENIAAGYGTAKAAFEGWQEKDDMYSRQGHRRSMLSPNYSYIGIGHVYYNGIHYWVQEFSSVSTSTVETPANDSETTGQVEILLANITATTVSAEKSSYTVEYGQTIPCPVVEASLTVTGHWPSYTNCPVQAPAAFTIKDSQYASVANDEITGLKVGSTTVAFTSLGATGDVPLTVTQASLASAEVTLDKDIFTYTGGDCEPGILSVKLGNTTLEAGTDYEISYENNVNAGTGTGTAKAVITGIGNYKDTAEAVFTIEPCDVGTGTIAELSPVEYNGSAWEPSITLKVGENTLEQGTDYELAYEDNTNAGTATVTAAGQGNYKGTLSASFEITRQYITEADVQASDLTYTGSALVPEDIAVSLGDTTLTTGTDYTVEVTDNTNAGTASITVTGQGNYQGTAAGSFTISPRNIAECETAAIAAVTYTGSPLCPEIQVSWDGKALTAGTDYAVTYEKNTDAGTAAAAIEGRGNFTGSVKAEFTVLPCSLKNAWADAIADQVYSGSPLTPEVTVKTPLSESALVISQDYTVNYSDNTAAGEAAVKIVGTGNYTDEFETVFTIVPKPVTEGSVAVIPDQQYTGSAIVPDTELTVDGVALEPETDYTVEASANENVGTASLTFKGTGNYTGECSASFEITARDIEDFQPGVIADLTYTGSPLCPDVSLNWGEKVLQSGTDYEISYEHNTDAGTAAAILQGIGNYTGSVSTEFTILPCDLNRGDVAAIEDQMYSGSALEPAVTVTVSSIQEAPLTPSDDYIVTYEKNVDAGEAEVKISGTGNYTGERNTVFRILPRTVSDGTVAAVPSQQYTGAAILPAVELTVDGILLDSASDYEVSGAENTDIGTAQLTITGKGNYTGECSASFEITARDIATCQVGEIAPETYSGSQFCPAVVVSQDGRILTAGTDYAVTYEDNTNAGTAVAVIAGTGNYTGEARKEFTILPYSLANAAVGAIADMEYSGSPLTPEVTVTAGLSEEPLKRSEDYTVTYEHNTNAGTATVKIQGTGNYGNSTEVTFEITPKSISGGTVADIPDQPYTGSEIIPAVELTVDNVLLAPSDYTVSAEHNVKLGTADLTITGTGNYTGECTADFEIVQREIAACQIDDIPDQTYEGTDLRPEVTVSLNGTPLTQGTDYEVNYEDNEQVGTGKAVIHGLGNYTGTAELSFTIKEPETDPPETDPPQTDPVQTEPAQTETPSTETPQTPATPETTLPTPCTHSWFTSRIEPTVLTEGQEIRTCALCGEKEITTLACLQPVIELSASSLTMKKGQKTRVLKVTRMQTGDEIESITSSNKKVVTVSRSTGRLTAKKTGRAVITIRLKSGISASCPVKVQSGKVKTKSIQLSTKKITLQKGKKATIKVTLNPLTSQQKVTFKSSNKKVATVSSKGVVKARKKGKAKITVTSGSRKVTCQIIVK